jgi:hypothetical protein
MAGLKWLALAFLLSLPVPAAADPEWRTSFVAGVTDPGGDPLHATEVREFAQFGSPAKLYAGTSGWLDQAADVADRGSAQIIRLDGPDDPWRLEVNFNSLCPTQAKCALAVGALQSLQWKKSETNVNVNVWTLVASDWPIGPKPLHQSVYVRNNSDLKWYETTLNQTDVDPGHIRVFDVHMDQVAGKYWGFAGGQPAVYHGQLSDKRGAGQNIIHWATGLANAEADFSSMTAASEPNCIHGARVLGLQEARGKEFLAVCYHLYRRVDGDQGSCGPSEVADGNRCSPRWVRFWDEPFAGTGEGLRGLTTVTINSKQYLLVVDESATARVWQVDPDTGNAFVELDIANFVESHWGSPVGYIIAGYNSPLPLFYGADGIGRRIIGLEVNTEALPLVPGHSKVMLDGAKAYEGDGWFLVRNAPSSYQLHRMPAVLPQTLMLSVRDAIASPWEKEWVYFGGFDGNASPEQTPCRAEPCAFPPLVRIPTHDTGWIVKGRLAQ